MLSGQLVTPTRTARWWFTDRHGGISAAPYDDRNLAAHVGDDLTAVRANREQLESELNAGPLSWMGPVHGVDVELLDVPRALVPNVDALATTSASNPLVTLGADCVPLLMVAGDLAIAAHVGWRGFVDGMTATLVALLADHGIAPDAAQVVLGPAICGSCYGVPEDRADAIRDASAQAVVRAANGGPGADIRLGLTAQWTAFGAAVTSVGPCTFEDRHYFSHRRDGVTGRQAGVIAWQ